MQIDSLPNVEMIRSEGFRLIRGRVMAQVRAELREGVKRGLLIRIPKKGLAPEAYAHPDHAQAANEARLAEATEAVSRISQVIL